MLVVAAGPSAGHLGDQLAQRSLNSLQPLALRQLAGGGPRHHDHVVALGQLALLAREGLAHEALDPIALHRAADLARDRHPKARRAGRAVREGVDNEVAIGAAAPVSVHPLELRAA